MRKFLNSARFYRCAVLVMGGDISAKMIVRIVAEGPASYRARLFGTDEVVDAEGLPALRKRITDAGDYAYDTELTRWPSSAATRPASRSCSPA